MSDGVFLATPMILKTRALSFCIEDASQTSIARTNRSGDNGSPWRMPLVTLKKP